MRPGVFVLYHGLPARADDAEGTKPTLNPLSRSAHGLEARVTTEGTMDGTAALKLEYERQPAPTPGYREIFWLVLALAMPALFEQVFNFLVGLNDTWLANNLPDEFVPMPAARAGAPAAVGTISYLLWFIGLIVGAVGTGSTALIARAKGARHRRLANGVCGQSISAS